MRRGQRWAGVGLAVALASATVAACSAGSGGTAATTTTAKRTTTTAGAADGATIFRTNCAECHGADGTGGQGPALVGPKASGISAAEATKVVTNGRKAMPPWKSELSPAEIDAVVAYVRGDLGDPGGATTTTAVTTERGSLSGRPPELAGSGNWPVANGDLLARRVAKGSRISSKTIGQLEEAWTYDAPGGATFGNFPTNPLVVGDHVYVGDLTTRIHAVDLQTGKEQFVVGDDASIFGPTGVGVGWGRLYGTKANANGRGTVVVAYDADDGKELWATDIGANGGDINVQPVAYDGLVYSATSGYGAGTRATIYALDAETGAIVWSFAVVEDPNLWGHPELNSGGGVWYPPTIDAAHGVAYFGTGNPYPFPGAKGFPNGASRPGDNRWTDSILALDLKTGKLRWGHQAIAHDIFDRDSMLTGRVDVRIGSRTRRLAISTGKLGVVTALDASTGKVVWKTPVGTHQNDELTKIDGPTLVYPGSLGGVQTPMAVSDGTIYLCVMNAPTQYAGPEETSYGFTVQLGKANSQMVAIDAATGEIEGSVDLPGDSFGGATVAGDLVFTSSFGGEILALDLRTGETVWSYEAPGGINGWPAVAGDELYVPVGMADPPQLLKFELPD